MEQLKTPEISPKMTIEPPKTRLLKKMPDPELLDAFISGLMGGRTEALFDAQKGEFKWIKSVS